MGLVLEPNAEPIPGYKLRRLLGKGGSGEVWQVEAPGGVDKAMKITMPQSLGDVLTARELEGLQKIRSVRHPFLLSIDRFEIHDGYLVIVMELADESLADLRDKYLKSSKRGIPREELLGYLREAAEVLDMMNQQYGLQHLDVKPNNLLLLAGHVKVADFGLVQPRDADMSRAMLAFTPGYVPPEVFDGRIEPSADQYALAVTFQELLTGIRPFHGTSITELACRQMDEPPNLAPLPADDQIVIRRALQNDVRQRFQTCNELVKTLANSAEYRRSLTESQLKLHAPVAPSPAQAGLTITPSKLLGVTPGKKFHPPPAPPGSKFAGGKPWDRSKTANSAAPAKPEPVGKVTSDGDQIRSTFLATLPLEMYALKLRAFIDAMQAQVMNVSKQSTELLLTPKRGWLGLRSQKGIHLKLDVFCRSGGSQYSVVDVTIWSTMKNLQGQNLLARSMLLIRCLKSYFMAREEQSTTSFEPAALRNQLWGQE